MLSLSKYGGRVSFWGFHVHFSEVLHQQAMDEDVSATDAAQEDEADLTSFMGCRVDSGIVNHNYAG